MTGPEDRDATAQVDAVKRVSGPQTTNGRRWQVQLSAEPSSEWLEIFRASGQVAPRMLPHRVDFDRASAAFRSEEGQVELWIQSIDRWIASTNAKYLTIRERVRRDLFDRVDAEAREKERIQGLNDRFKDL